MCVVDLSDMLYALPGSSPQELSFTVYHQCLDQVYSQLNFEKLQFQKCTTKHLPCQTLYFHWFQNDIINMITVLMAWHSLRWLDPTGPAPGDHPWSSNARWQRRAPRCWHRRDWRQELMDLGETAKSRFGVVQKPENLEKPNRKSKKCINHNIKTIMSHNYAEIC